MRLPLLLLPLLTISLSLAQEQPPPTPQRPELSDTSSPLLQRANALLSSGSFSEAARAFTDLIEASPSSTPSDPSAPPYLLYYKRATAYFSLSRHQNAIEDYDKVLELNGEMVRAYLMKARCQAREGKWADARATLKAYSKRKSKSKDKDKDKDTDVGAADLTFELAEAEEKEKKARQAKKAGGWAACQAACLDALKVGTHSWGLREMRAECAMADGQIEDAIADYTKLTHLRPSDTSLLLRLATLTFYLLSNPQTPALTHVKSCLHSDPESKPCLTAHRTLKSLTKALDGARKMRDEGKWASLKRVLEGPEGLLARFEGEMAKALSTLNPPLPKSLNPSQLSQPYLELLTLLVTSHTHTSTARLATPHCNHLLSLLPTSTPALVCLGQSAMESESWDEAVRYFERAWEAEGRPRQGDTVERLQKAQKVLKQSKSKDYYKVIGVARDADQKTIKKAYRKATMKAHPDKGGSEEKMAALNEAYEVLSNEDLRRRYDAGDDPNDPMAGQGGHPFFQGGSPFEHFFQGGGSPFGQGGGARQFQFRWNG